MTQEPTRLAEALDAFPNARVLCIGDLMLDHFVYGSATRISPEAPIPVFNIDHETSMLGGAGNVVRNILSLGAQVNFVSVVGDDDIGRRLMRLIGEEARVEPYLLVEKGRITGRKTRYIAGNQHLLRADHETARPVGAQLRGQILAIAEEAMERSDIVVLSDYAKGVITQELAQKLIELARQHGKPVLVDPKSRDLSVYAGATLITPNQAELTQAVGGAALENEEALTRAAGEVLAEAQAGALLVTRGKQGMNLFRKDGADRHFPALAREVYDVSGAGDTVIATLAVAMGSGLALEDAAFLANVAAGVVVSKVGTAVAYRTDISRALHTEQLTSGEAKILPYAQAQEKVETWRRQGRVIGFTNGCFDLLHPGHVTLLNNAKAQCDRLILGLNSDSSVQRLKGDGRPVQNEMSRAMVLASMAAVDMVVIFREDTPMKLIEAFRPDVLVKGADYTKDQVVGGEFVESYGGEVALVPLVEGNSTSKIIAKIG